MRTVIRSHHRLRATALCLLTKKSCPQGKFWSNFFKSLRGGGAEPPSRSAEREIAHGVSFCKLFLCAGGVKRKWLTHTAPNSSVLLGIFLASLRASNASFAPTVSKEKRLRRLAFKSQAHRATALCGIFCERGLFEKSPLSRSPPKTFNSFLLTV